MKKLLLTVCCVLAVSATFAQRSKIARAENYSEQEKPNFVEARKAIQEAIKHEKTATSPKTYYVAGRIGYLENNLFVNQMMLQKKIDVNEKGETIMESYHYLITADSLDRIPNKKGKVKPKYSRRIREILIDYYNKQYNLIGYGAKLYEEKKYGRAFDVFNVYLSIPDLEVTAGEIKKDSTYDMINYFAAVSATSNKDHKNAILRYSSLKDSDYETNNVYQLLAAEYLELKDTANYLTTLQEGFTKFTNEPFYLQSLINYYINNKKLDEANEYLNQAIEKAPNVAEYHYVKGNLEERVGNVDVARAEFEKAIELAPEKAEAHAGIGRLIFNKAVNLLNQANEITDNKLYEMEVKKADGIFREAQPFMEKAVELNPDDMDFKQALKQLYYRIDTEKYDQLTKELNK